MKRGLAIVATCLGLCLVWWLTREKPEIPGEKQPQLGQTCVFQLGQRWAYTAKTASFIRADLGALMGGLAARSQQDVREIPVQLRWRLDLDVVQTDEDAATIRARWSDVSADGGAGGAVARGDDLKWPALFRLGHDCQVRSVGRHIKSTDSAARTQQSALMALSFRLPLPGQPQRVDVVERPIGTCSMRHLAQTQDESIVVKQRLLGCQSVRGGRGERADPAVGVAEFKLDEGPWFGQVDGQQLIVLRKDGREATRLRSELHVKRADPATDAAKKPDLRDFSWGWVAAVPSEGQVAARAWPGLESMAAKDAVEEILRLWASGKDGTMGARDFARAWLQKNPDKAGALLAALRDKPAAEDVRAAMYHVVGRFGGKATRAALIGTMRDATYDDGDRSRAALAMAALPNPDSDNVDALVEASKRSGIFADKGQTVGHSATLALGMMSHEQRGKNDGISDQIADHLRSASQQPDEGLAAEALSAIGNSADPGLLDVLSSNLEGESEDLRAKAAAALRLMDPEQSAKLMASKLATEHSELVIQRLAEAAATAQLAHHKPVPATVITAADQAMNKAKASTAVRALVQLLGAAGDNPAAKAALKKAFDRGADPATLRLIGMYMSADELMPKPVIRPE